MAFELEVLLQNAIDHLWNCQQAACHDLEISLRDKILKSAACIDAYKLTIP